LGVSVPTVKRMVDDGLLEAFRTPGGHRRVSAESIEAVRDQRRGQARPALIEPIEKGVKNPADPEVLLDVFLGSAEPARCAQE